MDITIEKSLPTKMPPVNVGAPMVSSLPRAMIKSSDYEFMRKMRSEYANAWEANRFEQNSIITAWRYYFGAEHEQWDDEVRDAKAKNNERIAQYNMIKHNVDTFAGMLIADEYTGQFNPIDGVKTTGIEALELAYESDKENCNYDYHYGLVVQDGVIHVGIMEVKVVNDYDPMGNICFRHAIPMRWITDPYWKSDDDRDCMKAWKQGHMTIKQLENAFGRLPSSPKYETEKQRIHDQGMCFTDPTIDEYNYPFPMFKNAFHVVEYHWVEELHKKRIVARNVFGEWVPFPVTDDNERLQQFADENMVTNFQEGESVIVPYKDKIHYSATMCQELWPYKLLEHGKPEVQIQGLPIIQFTCKRDIAGRNMGKVQDLIDPQKDINYSQSKIWELLANQLGGGLIYNKKLLPDESDQEEYKKHHNDPTKSWGIDGPPNEFSAHLRDANISPELIRKTGEPFEYAQRISGVSAAMQSETQGSSEPASLYAMKLKVNKIGTLTIDKRVRHFNERLYEAYYRQAQITYAGNERKFSSKDGKKEAILNERLGNGMIKNKVEDLPRISVTITESPNNLTKQMRDRAELAAVLESIPPEYREAISIAYTALFETTSISEEKKASITEALMLEQIKARIASIAEITNSEATAKQGQLMSIQIGAQIDKIVGMLGQMQPQPQELEQMVSREPQAQQETTTISPEIAQQGQPPEVGMQNPAMEIQEPI